MAIYRTVQLSFWTDEKVLDDFTPEDKYFYLYLFTNPQTNLIGCYELGWTATTSQLGYTKDTVLRLLERFENVHHVIRYSKATKEVLLLNWWKYNCTKSPKLDRPLLEQIQEVKSSSFKMHLMELYNERNTVEIPYQYPMDTTVTVTVTDNNIKSYSNKSNIDNLNYLLSNNTDITNYINNNTKLLDVLKEWLEYKQDKGKQHLIYAEKSLRSLIDKFLMMDKQYGTDGVVYAIHETITNGWQGIVWNKAEEFNKYTKSKPQNKSQLEYLLNSIKEDEDE